MRVVIGILTESKDDELHDDATRFLVARRRRDRPYARCWEFPGGKIEEGESDPQALKREWPEELGVEIFVGQRPIYEGTFLHEKTEKLFTVVAYRISLADPKQPLVLRDHDALGWYTRKEIEAFDKLTPSTMPLLRSMAPVEPAKEEEVKEKVEVVNSSSTKQRVPLISTKISGNRERATYCLKGIEGKPLYLIDIEVEPREDREDAYNVITSVELTGSTNLLWREQVKVSDLLAPIPSKEAFEAIGERNLKTTPLFLPTNEITILVEGKKPPWQNNFPPFFWISTEPPEERP